MKKLLTTLNAWRRNQLFVTAAEARRACDMTFRAGQQDTHRGFAQAVLSLTNYKAERHPAKKYDIRLTVDAKALDTEAGDVAGAVAISEDIAARIVEFHRGRKAK